MNFQDVIRDVHDATNHALNISGTISAAGQATVTLNTSTSFIGIVTVANQTSAALSGNVTLNPSLNYIGFATVNVAGFGPAISVSPAAAGDFGWWQEDDGHTSGQKGVFALAVRNSLPTLMTSAELDYSSFSVDEYGRTLVAGNPTVFIGTPTLYAVVNTGAVGVTNSIVTVANTPLPVNVIGNVTVSDAKTYIGLTTTTLGVGTQFIGLVTVAPHSLVGNLTLSDAKTYIGLNTSTLGLGDRFIGLVTATLGASPAFVGIVTIANSVGNATLNPSPNFIGLVTANAINIGTNKTLVSLPVGLGNNSLATVAVPTNANKIKVTNLVLGSNVTTEIAIKSGVTYLTGNASLGITLFPGGGFELPGSPDSPSWIGLPSGAIVIEKRDGGGTVSKIGGGLIYFDEA